jgi:hypothetical protein
MSEHIITIKMSEHIITIRGREKGGERAKRATCQAPREKGGERAKRATCQAPARAVACWACPTLS